uniref:Uncharacterized protein n=1 Tax=Euplotes crassus TaxID=5936 RepID=A0A7S3KP43_EUPCR
MDDPFKTNRIINSSSLSRQDKMLPLSPNSVTIKPYKGKVKKSTTMRNLEIKRPNTNTKQAVTYATDALPPYSSFSSTGFINLDSNLKISGPSKQNLKKLLKNSSSRLTKAQRQKYTEALQKSIKLQQATNKIMFRTTLAGGIRTGPFKDKSEPGKVAATTSSIKSTW